MIKGNTYKVKENFMSKFSDNVISEFNKNEVLEYMGSFLDWYDSEYIVTFKFNKIEYKSIYIHESYCDLECEKCKSDTQLIAELQSYEKYFERID